MVNLAKSFGDTLQTLQVDLNNKEIPSSTAEILTNVLGNLQSKNSAITEQFRYTDSNQPQSSSSDNKTQTKSNLGVWKLLKLSIILSILFVILGTEFIKNLVTKVTDNHILYLSILVVTFIMISFCLMKWML